MDLNHVNPSNIKRTYNGIYSRRSYRGGEDVEKVMNDSIVRFTMTVGSLLRGHVIKEIRDFCFLHGYDVTIEEGKGFFESDYRVKITLPSKDVGMVRNAFSNWFKKLER